MELEKEAKSLKPSLVNSIGILHLEELAKLAKERLGERFEKKKRIENHAKCAKQIV
ncbi:MAG: hypothetical protein IPO33_09980 [Saprospiraceae bacterium]|nr:hypothetical protein [Candidatus Brachybacter algidus]